MREAYHEEVLAIGELHRAARCHERIACLLVNGPGVDRERGDKLVLPTEGEAGRREGRKAGIEQGKRRPGEGHQAGAKDSHGTGVAEVVAALKHSDCLDIGGLGTLTTSWVETRLDLVPKEREQ